MTNQQSGPGSAPVEDDTDYGKGIDPNAWSCA